MGYGRNWPRPFAIRIYYELQEGKLKARRKGRALDYFRFFGLRFLRLGFGFRSMNGLGSLSIAIFLRQFVVDLGVGQALKWNGMRSAFA